jgi:hypothetical protein
MLPEIWRYVSTHPYEVMPTIFLRPRLIIGMTALLRARREDIPEVTRWLARRRRK